MFNGLVETLERRSATASGVRWPSGPTVPVVLAGPTCDSLDILYERELYPLPDDVAPGHPVDLLSAGAYTTSYSSVWFNGFEPLRSVLPATHTRRDAVMTDHSDLRAV